MQVNSSLTSSTLFSYLSLCPTAILCSGSTAIAAFIFINEIVLTLSTVIVWKSVCLVNSYFINSNQNVIYFNKLKLVLSSIDYLCGTVKTSYPNLVGPSRGWNTKKSWIVRGAKSPFHKTPHITIYNIYCRKTGVWNKHIN